MGQSFSLDDALDREAMAELHKALLAVDARVRQVIQRGFTIELMQEVEEMVDGKAVTKAVPFDKYGNGWDADASVSYIRALLPLLADAELPPITDETVERHAAAAYAEHTREGAPPWSRLCGGTQAQWRAQSRAALEAVQADIAPRVVVGELPKPTCGNTRLFGLLTARVTKSYTLPYKPKESV